jgi:hypothetical protein
MKTSIPSRGSDDRSSSFCSMYTNAWNRIKQEQRSITLCRSSQIEEDSDWIFQNNWGNTPEFNPRFHDAKRNFIYQYWKYLMQPSNKFHGEVFWHTLCSSLQSYRHFNSITTHITWSPQQWLITTELIECKINYRQANYADKITIWDMLSPLWANWIDL